MTGWQTPERVLTRALSNLRIGQTYTFQSWTVKRDPQHSNVYLLYFAGVSSHVARFASKHGGAKLIARIVRCILDSVIQRPLLPGMPDVLAVLVMEVRKTRQRVSRVIREFARKLHKKPKATLTIDELPLFAWRPSPAGQRVA